MFQKRNQSLLRVAVDVLIRLLVRRGAGELPIDLGDILVGGHDDPLTALVGWVNRD